jgi:hypothetical protein
MDTMDTVDLKKLILYQSETYKQNGAPRYEFFGKSYPVFYG